MKSFLPKKVEINKRDWVVIDAKGKSLGRIAVVISKLLRGKNRVDYSPQVDNGSFVVVLNAADVKLTGKKEEKKIYQTFSGYRDGLKRTKAATIRERHPERLISLAVWGMIPKNRTGRKLMRRLKVFAGSAHPYSAQKPQKADVK